MRREVVLAITIGFFIGLLLSAGLILGRQTIRERISLPQFGHKQVEEPPVSPQPSPLTTVTIAPMNLKIVGPEDDSLVSEDKIVLEGITQPQAVIAVIYEEGEVLGQADENGHFSFDIPLIGGANEMTITAYGSEEQEASQTITVVYTTAEI